MQKEPYALLELVTTDLEGFQEAAQEVLTEELSFDLEGNPGKGGPDHGPA